MAMAGILMLVGMALWVAGFHWGVVLVVLGLAGVFIAGIWGIRPTRGTDPNDPSADIAMGYYQSQSLVELHQEQPPS
jgi:hypothetical protein